MDPRVEEQAKRLESILPLILRTIYPPREDDPLAELPLMQLRVLRTLSDGRKPMSDLADELRMSVSRLAHLVSRLENAGLVEKHADPEDRRIKIVGLTQTGLSHMATHRALRSVRSAAILDSLSEEERDSVMATLELLFQRAKSISQVGSVAQEVEILR
jgi:DNA-binding MarR family transcriptional regulator